MSSSSSYESSHDGSSSEEEETAMLIMNVAKEGAMLIKSFVDHYVAESSNPTPPRTRIRHERRDRLGAHDRLVADYFGDNPVYDGNTFRRRFRMSRDLFSRIVTDVETHSEYFQQREDARRIKGFSGLQKCTAAIRQLAYGTVPDSHDEYLNMSERVARDSCNMFCSMIIRLYGREFLRRPTISDIHRLYHYHATYHGFPGMLGSIDCMHWAWENCPIQYRGQYMRGDHPHPTIMLEAVVSQDLWFWHAFFGVAGSNNDINVLNQSPLFNDEKDGVAPEMPFIVNGNVYAYGYYLADGIYPEHATFVRAYRYPSPEDHKQVRFKRAQEAARKDVERAFGVLKKRWGIIHNPARAVKPELIGNVIYACIILHNMILKDEGNAICPDFHEEELPDRTVQQDSEARRRTILELRDRDVHHRLRYDLTEHIHNQHIASIDNEDDGGD